MKSQQLEKCKNIHLVLISEVYFTDFLLSILGEIFQTQIIVIFTWLINFDSGSHYFAIINQIPIILCDYSY